jgi:hypothetical protein
MARAKTIKERSTEVRQGYFLVRCCKVGRRAMVRQASEFA